MKYNALLFCPDDKTARLVAQILTDLEFHVESCNEPFAAVKKLMAEHYDAIVVDCESEQNATLLFKSAHSSGSNQSSLSVAVVEGQAGVAKAFRIGANLVLTKPINVEQSKGTLRVARGLLRKTDAAKPASAMPAATAPARPAVTSLAAKSPSAPQIPAQKPASSFLPAQPLPSPIPSVSASVFDVEAEPTFAPEPAEAALLESMPKPAPPAAREYPWQPIAKPAAEPMSAALRRAAEATGRSDVDATATGKIPFTPPSISTAPISHSYSSMAGGQAAATAPAKIISRHQDAQMSPMSAPTFSSLGDTSDEPASSGGKKFILIAIVLLAAPALGYFGWTKMHSAGEAPVAQSLPAPTFAPVQPKPSAAISRPSQDVNGVTATQSGGAPPVEHGPDITLSTPSTRPSVPRQTTSIVAPNTVTRAPSDANEPAPFVVKRDHSNSASPNMAALEPVQPPAPASISIAPASDSAISGLISTTTTNLPQQAPQKLRVSQGVSQGLLIKSVPPVYPPLARQMRVQGNVELLASIGKDGSITGVKLLSGEAVLAHAAIDAVKQWKYKPYYLDDQPVAIQTQVTVKFKLP